MNLSIPKSDLMKSIILPNGALIFTFFYFGLLLEGEDRPLARIIYYFIMFTDILFFLFLNADYLYLSYFRKYIIENIKIFKANNYPEEDKKDPTMQLIE